jgi:hypothetical protein
VAPSAVSICVQPDGKLSTTEVVLSRTSQQRMMSFSTVPEGGDVYDQGSSVPKHCELELR